MYSWFCVTVYWVANKMYQFGLCLIFWIYIFNVNYFSAGQIRVTLNNSKSKLSKTESEEINGRDVFRTQLNIYHRVFFAKRVNPAGIYLLKVNNRNIRTRSKICSKLIIKIPERRQWRCSGIFIANFELISHLGLVLLLLTLNM